MGRNQGQIQTQLGHHLEGRKGGSQGRIQRETDKRSQSEFHGREMFSGRELKLPTMWEMVSVLCCGSYGKFLSRFRMSTAPQVQLLKQDLLLHVVSCKQYADNKIEGLGIEQKEAQPAKHPNPFKIFFSSLGL